MERIVHIIPLGWEFDRAVLPVKNMYAHRVHLLCNPDDREEQQYFFDKVRRELIKAGVDVKHVKVNVNDDLKGVMREVARLVQEELRAGNRVHINMSAAGKVAAAGATLAAMAHLTKGRGIIYYVVSEGYSKSDRERSAHGLAKGMLGEPLSLPLFELNLPENEGRLVLRALAGKRDKRMSYGDLIALLASNKVSGFEGGTYTPSTPRPVKNKLNLTLNKRILAKLHRAGLVRIESQGRARSAFLTEAGEYVASLCGDGDRSSS